MYLLLGAKSFPVEVHSQELCGIFNSYLYKRCPLNTKHHFHAIFHKKKKGLSSTIIISYLVLLC